MRGYLVLWSVPCSGNRKPIEEIDEVLDTRVQVVYTVGNPQPLDGKADRWDIPRHLLCLLAKQVIRLQQENPI